MSELQPVIGYIILPNGYPKSVIDVLFQRLVQLDLNVWGLQSGSIHVSAKVATFEKAFKCKLRMVNNYWEFETEPDITFLRSEDLRMTDNTSPQLFLITTSTRC